MSMVTRITRTLIITLVVISAFCIISIVCKLIGIPTIIDLVAKWNRMSFIEKDIYVLFLLVELYGAMGIALTLTDD